MDSYEKYDNIEIIIDEQFSTLESITIKTSLLYRFYRFSIAFY